MDLPGWRASKGPGPDLVSVDGSLALEVKSHANGGLRDLRAGLMQLATWLVQRPEVRQAILAIRMPRITHGRVQQVWSETQAALKPSLARRLALIAFTPEGSWAAPHSTELGVLADAISSQVAFHTSQRAIGPSAAGSSQSLFEVTKVLLEAWLRRAGPLRIQEITRLTGCSHPTVALALDQLERRQELERTRDRRAGLRGLPRRTLEEATVLGETLRQTRWVIDVSGRPGDLQHLMRRLERSKSGHIAIGGVVAARHYDAGFDLNGLPRLDLTIWARRGQPYEPAKISELDAGLLLVPTSEPGVIAAVHRLSRADSLFRQMPRTLPYADPVEVLLDLYELRLDAQARDFAKHLRSGAG